MNNTERALLSCVSQDPAVIGAEVLSVFQGANPFTDDIVFRVYEAWRRCGDPSSWPSMAILDVLETATFKADWSSELRAVQNAEPSTANWRQHMGAVRTAFVKRLAKKELEHALHGLGNTSSVTTYLQELAKKLVTIDTNDEREQSVDEAMSEELERRRNAVLSINTGLDKIDSHLGALIPGEVLLVAARPSVGKSVVAHNIIRNIASHNCPVGVLSLEMPIPQVVSRIISSVAQYDSRMVLDNMHQQAVHNAYEWVKSLPVYYDDRSGLHIAQVVNRIRRWSSNYGIKAVVLDYVQLLKTNERKSCDGISVAMKDIKAVCKELGIVPIILSQINRAGAKNDEGKPTLEDLKGSGSLEEDSSYVVLMHRDVVLTPDERESVANGGSVPLEIIVAKNRHGSTGYNVLSFVPKYCMVQDRVIEEVPE